MTLTEPQEDAEPPRIAQISKKSQRCRFAEIPPPSKYIYSSPLYSLSGDLPFILYHGKVAAEISLYNQIKSYRDITVTHVNEQAIITIKPTPRAERNTLDWTELVNTMSIDDDPETDDWIKTIKSYCLTYSKVLHRQSRKKMKSEPRKKFFYQVTSGTNYQNRQLFETYPCLKLKFRAKNHQNQLKEIVVNEKFVKEIGHSVDSFISTLYAEGFPQIMPYNSPLGSLVMKVFLKNYFTIPHHGCELSGLICPLLIKNNFAKNMTFNAYFFMNYEDSVFGMDITLAVTSVDEPYALDRKALGQETNTDFVEMMSALEGEADYFMANFYEQPLKKTYRDFNRICTIREIYQFDRVDALGLSLELE